MPRTGRRWSAPSPGTIPCWSSPPTRRKRRRSLDVFASCRKNFPEMEWYETQMRTDPMTLMNPPTKMKPPNPLPEPVAPRDLFSIHDLAPAEILSLFNLTSMLKQRPADFRGTLAGKQMVMFFEKPSPRTRLTFEAGMDSLGGSTFFVDQPASRLNARESLYDIPHNLER